MEIRDCKKSDISSFRTVVIPKSRTFRIFRVSKFRNSGLFGVSDFQKFEIFELLKTRNSEIPEFRTFRRFGTRNYGHFGDQKPEITEFSKIRYPKLQSFRNLESENSEFSIFVPAGPITAPTTFSSISSSSQFSFWLVTNPYVLELFEEFIDEGDIARLELL